MYDMHASINANVNINMHPNEIEIVDINKWKKTILRLFSSF